MSLPVSNEVELKLTALPNEDNSGILSEYSRACSTRPDSRAGMWIPIPLPTAHDPFGSHCQKQVIRRRFVAGSDGVEGPDGPTAVEVLATGSRGGACPFETAGGAGVEDADGSCMQNARRETCART